MVFRHVLSLGARAAVLAVLACQQGHSAPAAPEHPGAGEQTLVQRLLRIAGLTAVPSQLRGPDDAVAFGDLWISDLSGGHMTTPLTTDGGYASPVFANDGGIYALKGMAIVRVSRQGKSPVEVQRVTGVVKLVGFDGAADDLIVLLEPARAGSPLGVVSLKSGKLTVLSYHADSENERRMLAEVRGQGRVYGDTTVYTKAETKSGLSRTLEWTDIYVKRGSEAPRNVSLCDGATCSQPTLSPDGHTVVYVKTAE
jgi:hypothetical protein